MAYEKPATGIYKTTETDDVTFYTVACDCGDSDHFHDMMVTVGNDHMVSVELSVLVDTDTYDYRLFEHNNNAVKKVANFFYSRMKTTFDIWFKGKTRHFAEIFLDDQAAYNYAHTILKARSDVKKSRKK